MIVIQLNPSDLDNPDLDMRYSIPDRIEELSAGEIKSLGYDYVDDEFSSIVLLFESDNLESHVPRILKMLREESFSGNSVLGAAIIAVGQEDNFQVIHPENYSLAFSI